MKLHEEKLGAHTNVLEYQFTVTWRATDTGDTGRGEGGGEGGGSGFNGEIGRQISRTTACPRHEGDV